MNISSTNQGNVKEWLNVSNHLKELNDNALPSSQSYIEWNFAECEEEMLSNKRKSLLILKSKGKSKAKYKKHNVEKDKHSKSKGHLYCSDTNKLTNEGSKSPVFKIKPSKRSCPYKQNIQTLTNSFTKSDNTNEINVKAISQSAKHVCKTIFTKGKATDWEVNEENIEPLNASSNEQSSPVLKSRLKCKRLETVSDFRHLPIEVEAIEPYISPEKRKVQSDSDLEKNKTSLIKTNASVCVPFNDPLTNENVNTFHLSKKQNQIVQGNHFMGNAKIFNKFKEKSREHHSDFDVGNEANIKSNFKLSYSQPEELDMLIITDSQSPVRDQAKKFDSSTTPSIESQESDNMIRDWTANQRRGSEWVKDLQNKTPDKDCHLSVMKTSATPSQAPDSSRKKIKKDGLAGQLRRLLYSWQSNVSMWNHQMSLALCNQGISCSLSPQLTNSDSRNAKLKNVRDSDSELSQRSAFSSNTSSSNLIHWRSSGRNIRLVTPPSNSLVLKGDENLPDISKPKKELFLESSLPSCSKGLRNSLEIRSPSQSPSLGLPSKASFVIPKRHLCVKVLKIEWQTTVMTSAMCQEVDYCSRSIKEAQTLERNPKMFLGMFGCMEIKSSKQLEVGNLVKIFAPWQILEVKSLAFPALFSSFFVITTSDGNHDSKTGSNIKRKEMLKLASWQCSCISDSHTIPSTCFGGKLRSFVADTDNASQTPKVQLKSCRTFTTVRDISLNSPKRDRYWTVLEAIEQCGGMPDIPVSVTVRIRRIYSMKNSSDKVPSHYLILGQDPSGVFLLVEVPNRPLKSTLEALLQKGEGTTRTLTHLSVSQRITDTQNPGLFSVINSLQNVYNQSINNNPQLLLLLKDQLKKPPQSFCYKFLVTLGQTVDIKIAEMEGISVTLPHWSIEEALQLNETAARGYVSVIILYYIHPYLYVTCKRQKELSRFVSSLAEKFSSLQKVTVKNSVWLQPWMKCNGTIMTSAVIEDIAVWRGSLIVDEFSRIQRIKNESFVHLQDLLALVSEFKTSSTAFDLVSVNGFIKDVNDEDSWSWDECGICRGHDLYGITAFNTKCQDCKTENISPITKYTLEIHLSVPNVDAELFHIKVKLFQTTIKKLLKGIPSHNKQYKMGVLSGAEIGPLVCFVKSVEGNSFSKTFLLLELPY